MRSRTEEFSTLFYYSHVLLGLLVSLSPVFLFSSFACSRTNPLIDKTNFKKELSLPSARARVSTNRPRDDSAEIARSQDDPK